MAEDRSLPVPVLIAQAIEIARLKHDALAAQPAAFDAGTIAALRRELAQARLLLAKRDHMLARYCETIDKQREELRIANETIALVAMQRDSWLREAKRLRPDLYPIDTGCIAIVHGAVWPAFPANALRGGDGIYRGG